MEIRDTSIAGVKFIVPKKFFDDRGEFSEIYKRSALLEGGIDLDFIQDNRSLSTRRYTVRGLHYQVPPFAQAKLVSVQAGRIWDVAVDLRLSSPSFGRSFGAELTAKGGEQLLIPAGFAHGFCTLEPDSVVTYKVDNRYAPSHERGLHWLCEELDIEWPCSSGDAFLAPKDAALPAVIDREQCFP
ncbi:MAG TPA: dTDP-4-dehydrorhamnose 3,5-epimerase [Alphaproteobacteria bacterium]|nr:dTDP-4-dehydrorhamnose 3,5-epimerase [Alphaproteobacteria bacterium]